MERFAHSFAGWAGSGWGFVTGAFSLIVWFIAGSYFQYSVQWENALSVYIGIITFLMIFLMQRSQKKELRALHVKLNELVVASEKADNRVINIEDQSEQEISDLHQTHGEISRND